jgi:hypothetical protein
MGYFSNGTEGMDYHERYCSRCVHDANDDCPVWNAHLLFSYQLCNAKDDPGKAILDMLIPDATDHLGNAQCTMFVERAASGDLFEQAAE